MFFHFVAIYMHFLCSFVHFCLVLTRLPYLRFLHDPNSIYTYVMILIIYNCLTWFPLAYFLISIINVLQEELLNIKAQLSQWFMPDDEYPLGAPLFMGTQNPCQPEIQAFDEVIYALFIFIFYVSSILRKLQHFLFSSESNI